MSDLPNLDAARAALEARRRGKWDDIALADALAVVDALTARLAEAQETLRSHEEEFKAIFAEVEYRTGEAHVGRASVEVARMAEFLLDAMKRNMLAAQREQRQIGDAEAAGLHATLAVRHRTINDAHAALDRAGVPVGGSVAERVDFLTARLAEAEATLANERGEGEPPSEGWTWTGTCWTRDLWNNEQARVSLDATGLDTEVPRWRCFLESADDWDGDFVVPSAPTARAAMRDADSALAAKVTP